MSGGAAVVRIARRSLRRDPWRALLVVVLICLPVLGITTASMVLEAAVPTAQERATRTLGAADMLAQPLGSYGRPVFAGLLPRGSGLAPVWLSGDQLLAQGTRPHADLLFADLTGPAAGMLTLHDGRLPAAPDEVAVSEAVLERAGVTVGDTITLGSQGVMHVVGRVEDPRALARLVVLGDPSLAERPGQWPSWLIRLPPGAHVEDVAGTIRDALQPDHPDQQQAMFDVTTRDEAGQASETFLTFVVLLGVLALVEAALVASAAFAVGIRRRQRELGLLGAAGATPRQLAASVLAEGLTAGIVAVVAGIVLGVAIARLIGTRLDGLTGQRAGPVDVDPVVLLAAGGIGLVAALIAAAVPAWSASRVPILVALSGRRPPSTPARRLLAFGGLLVLLALACSIVGPILARSGNGLVPVTILAVGAVAGVLGFGAASPWLLERLEGHAHRLSLAPRVALRDTARARTRNGPIVTAVMASVAAVIALASILASQEAQNMSWWRPDTARDSMIVRGAGSEAAGARVAQDLGAVGAGPDRWAIDPDGGGYAVVMPLLHPNVADDLVDTHIDIVVGDASLLTAYHGEAGRAALAAGDVVVLQAAMEPVTGEQGTVMRTDAEGGSRALGKVRTTIVPLRDDWADADSWKGSLAIMTPQTAQSLGVRSDPGPVQYLIRLDHDVTQADMDRAASIAISVDAGAYVAGPLRPPDPMLPFRLLLLAASLVAALTVTGLAVALGEAEARADQRTLLALGADRRLRRRITAARAAVIAVIAGFLAIPAGLLPVWGVLVPRGMPLVVPLPEVVGALVILPLAAVAGGLLLGRPIPEWSARRDGAG